MDRVEIGAIFSDLEQNERKLHIEQKITEMIADLNQQLLTNHENKSEIEKKISLLNQIKMPQKLKEILGKEPDQIELDLQSVVSNLYNQTKTIDGLLQRLDSLEQRSQQEPEFRKELLLHQLYSWVNGNQVNNHSTPIPTYDGYSPVNEKPSFEKMLTGLLEAEIEPYKNQENIQTLKRSLEDGSIEVLPVEYVEAVVKKLMDLNQITTQDRGCLRYYNQIANGKPLDVIPRSPYQEFYQITDYVDILPNELFDYSSSNGDLFRYGVAPGSSQFIHQIHEIKNNLLVDYQNSKETYEDLQNILNSGNIEFYYEFFIKNLSMDDLYDIATYVANLEKVQNHVPSPKLDEEQLKAVQINYNQEELKNVCDVFAENPSLFQVVEEKDFLDVKMQFLTDDLSEKCADFRYLFVSFCEFNRSNNGLSDNLESMMYYYYQSTIGGKVNADILQQAEQLKEQNPKMFEQIFEKFNDSNFMQTYQDYLNQQNELQLEQSRKIKGGLFNFGKAKAEQEQRVKIEQIEQKITSTKEQLAQVRNDVRDKLIELIISEYQEIKDKIPSASIYYTIEDKTKEVNPSELEDVLKRAETILHTNISGQLVSTEKERVVQQQQENKGRYYNLCENKPEVIKYIEQKSRPSMPIVQRLASGTYESDQFESDYLEQLKVNLVQESSIQM